MKTVRIFSMIAFIACACAAEAQTEQGRLMIGGTAGFNNRSIDDYSITAFNLNPNVGYFVIDNLALGGQLILEARNAEGNINDATAFGFTPYARYYFGATGPARFFGQARIGFGSEKLANFDAESFFTFGLGAGVDFFLNDNVALEAFWGMTTRSFRI